jgi:hypothetical protein
MFSTIPEKPLIGTKPGFMHIFFEPSRAVLGMDFVHKELGATCEKTGRREA